MKATGVGTEMVALLKEAALFFADLRGLTACPGEGAETPRFCPLLLFSKLRVLLKHCTLYVVWFFQA